MNLEIIGTINLEKEIKKHEEESSEEKSVKYISKYRVVKLLSF